MLNAILGYFMPEAVSVFLLIYFIFEATLAGKRDNRSIFSELAAGIFILAAVFIFAPHRNGLFFNGMLHTDAFAFYFKLFFTAVLGAIIYMARDFFKDGPARQNEFGLILWCTLIALYFLAAANHLLVMFITLEIITMAIYILAAYMKHDRFSIEAGLKYLIMGSVASAFMIFGIALLYLQTGELSFSGIAAAKNILWSSHLGILAVLFIFAGLGFKVSSFPFQLWVPDVYQGAPSPVSAFLAVASKAAGFLLLIRFFIFTVGPVDANWKIIFSALAFLTLLYGSVGALAQTSLKRLLGYSSIGHAGYLMIGIASGTVWGSAAILYYLAGYAASSLAAFYVVTLIEKQTGSDAAQNLDGLSASAPFLATTLAVALFSMAGLPPFAGFMGKFLILFSAMNAGLNGLTLAGLLMVLVGLYYYLALVLRMFFRRAATAYPLSALSLSAKIILVILSLLSLGIGIFQAPFVRWAVTALGL